MYCCFSTTLSEHGPTYPRWRMRQMGQGSVWGWARPHEYQQEPSPSSEIYRSGGFRWVCGPPNYCILRVGHLWFQSEKFQRAIMRKSALNVSCSFCIEFEIVQLCEACLMIWLLGSLLLFDHCESSPSYPLAYIMAPILRSERMLFE